MAGYKTPTFNERADAARDAKARALAKLKDRAAPDPAALAAREAAQAAKDAADADRRAAHKAQIEAEKQARIDARERAREEAEAKAAAEAAAALKRKIVVPTAAELKAARDARYAARKARQQKGG